MNLDKASKKIAIEQAKKEALKQMTEIVNNGLALQMELVMALVLHDKFGFGAKRCGQAIEGFEEMWDSINKKYLSLDDIEAVVKEEIGLVLRREGNSEKVVI